MYAAVTLVIGDALVRDWRAGWGINVLRKIHLQFGSTEIFSQWEIASEHDGGMMVE